MIALIEEVCFVNKNEGLLKKMSFPDFVQFDLDKITVAGHSFGGMTAISTA